VLLGLPTRGAQLLGIAVGFVCVVLVSLPEIGEGSVGTFGVALVVLAKVLALATIWTAPHGLWQIGDTSWELGPVVTVAVLGVVGTGVAFALMGTLVGRVGSTRASFITYLIPVVTLVIGVSFCDDEVFALELVGVGFVMGGAFLPSRPIAVRAAQGGSRRSGRTAASRHSGPSLSRRRSR